MPLLTTEQVDGVIRNLVQSFFERAGLAGMSYRDAAPLVGVTYQTLNNWARGTELLYQTMKLEMPEKVKENALEPGYFALSTEVLPEFAGDYIVLSKNQDGDGSFLETQTWKNIPAVQNNRVIELDTKAITYSDPITLEYLLDVFKKAFLEELN